MKVIWRSKAAFAIYLILSSACSGVIGEPPEGVDTPVRPTDETPADAGALPGADATVANPDATVEPGADATTNPDATTPADATASPDATSDPTDSGPACEGETDDAFCRRLGQTCGPVTAPDNCGRTRTVASCGSCPIAATPSFNPPPSPIAAAVQVTITTATNQATIYYTVDGATPSPGGATTRTYAGPVTVQPGTVLQAIAHAPGFTDSPVANGSYEAAPTNAPIGVNITWFNTWNESQPLADVAHTGRAAGGALPLDGHNEPNADFELIIYEGNLPGGPGGESGGAQFGAHSGRFRGQATLTGGGGTISNVRYDSAANLTTFTFTTTGPRTSQIRFTGTRRLPTDSPGTGVRELSIMRPGHNFNELLNRAFVQALTPFSVFRVGQNWDAWTYQTTPPVWANRAKPGGSFNTMDGVSGWGAPWETLAAMANELQRDLWICLPPNADDDYLRNIFRIFFYGSDGVSPYTSPQANPTWAPLAPERKLYFELGNEIWNTATPYGAITSQMQQRAQAMAAAGDPNHFHYASTSLRGSVLLREYYAWRTMQISDLARSIVGDANMMTRYRPIIAAQSGNTEVGISSLSYLMVVHGGHDWYPRATTDGHLMGEFRTPLRTPEDGVSINQFGYVAHPITHWIYGYAVAPYLHGGNVAALQTDLNNNSKPAMTANIHLANRAGVVALAYEGGTESYQSYTDAGLDNVVEDMLDYWFAEGGGPFVWFSLAGHSGSGLFPDLTRQSPVDWPKMRGIYRAKGLPVTP